MIEPFVRAWSNCRSCEVALYVVNGNPGDETSDLLSALSEEVEIGVCELAGSSDKFWTGLVKIGLQHVVQIAEASSYFVITNIDVRPVDDPLEKIFSNVPELDKCQTAIPVRGDDGNLLSAGVEVLSWPLSRNRHLLDRMSESELPGDSVIDATYLPTRFLLCRVDAIKAGNFPDEDSLPHYCADYEYTNRLRLNGYKPVVYTGALAVVESENTGVDTYLKSTSIRERVKGLWSIKCPYNAKYRYRFVLLTYPEGARISGMITHFAKILLEVLLGGKRLQGFREKTNSKAITK